MIQPTKHEAILMARFAVLVSLGLWLIVYCELSLWKTVVVFLAFIGQSALKLLSD